MNAQGGKFPKITNWAENVPVRGPKGNIVGRAKVSDNGQVHVVLDDAQLSKELFHDLLTGLMTGLSVAPHVTPSKYSDEVRRRLDAENKKEN